MHCGTAAVTTTVIRLGKLASFGQSSSIVLSTPDRPGAHGERPPIKQFVQDLVAELGAAILQNQL
jgi:hypothetical protein